MKKITLTAAAAMAAFFMVGCTQEVCTHYGKTTICRTERIPSEAEKSRRLKYASQLLDEMND